MFNRPPIKKLQCPRLLQSLFTARRVFGTIMSLKLPPVPRRVPIIRQASDGLMPLLTLLIISTRGCLSPRVPLMPSYLMQSELIG